MLDARRLAEVFISFGQQAASAIEGENGGKSDDDTGGNGGDGGHNGVKAFSLEGGLSLEAVILKASKEGAKQMLSEIRSTDKFTHEDTRDLKSIIFGYRAVGKFLLESFTRAFLVSILLSGFFVFGLKFGFLSLGVN